MGYTSPAAQSSGAVAPVSWATAVKAGLDYLANPPACRVTRSSSQSIANVTPTAISFDGESVDTDTMHDLVTNTSRITFKTAGLFVITANLVWESNATGSRDVWIQSNGSVRLAESATGANGSDVTIQNLTTIEKMAVNDYVELIAYQSSGAGRNVLSTLGGTNMKAVWIGLG